MGKCLICGESAPTISDGLGVCSRCIREAPEKALAITRQMHAKSRAGFGLPLDPPRDAEGLPCEVCANNCLIGLGKSGFCGLVWNVGGRLIRYGGTADKGILEWYYDPLPTNCVSWWFCPGCTGSGYPRYAHRPEAERGHSNLAVFYGACLPGFEKIFAVISGKPRIIAMGELVEHVLGSNPNITNLSQFTIAKSDLPIKVAVLDEEYNIKYAPLKRVSKRVFRGQMLKISLETGRTLYVTPDHPLLILQKSGFETIAAEMLRVGDYVPIVKHLPSLQTEIDNINLIDVFTKKGFEDKIMVHGAKQLLYGRRHLVKQLKVEKHLIDNWKRSDSLPLWVFNALSDGKSIPSKQKIGSKYSERKNLIKAILPMSRALARLLGYYLSEGCCSYGRIAFDVAWSEGDIADEIQSLLQQVFNVSSKREVKKWKGKESALRIDVRNRTLELIFKEVFGAGENCYNKCVPWFCYTWDEKCISELIDAYLIGDGHVRQSTSNHKNRESLIVLANTASQDLALGVNLLLSRLGVQVCLRPPTDSRNTYLISLQGGRNLQNLFKKTPGLFIRRSICKAPKSDPQALVPIFELYPSFLLQNLSSRVRYERSSLRKIKELSSSSALLNKLIEGDVHPIRVRKIESVPYEGYVYDLEVDSPTPSYATFTLASGVMIHNCSYDCLFCQNWRYRNLSVLHKPVLSAEALASKVDDKRVSCICFFGGDPSPQMPHSLEVSRIALEKVKAEKRILRICWETNGYMNPRLAERAAEYALESGGNIKFDLKAWGENLNIALCGVSNKPTLANFKMIGEKFYKKRSELPVLSASTLLVPGYVDVQEVENIAKFVSEIDRNIPYTLLAFYSCYVMYDLPTTNRKQAVNCQNAAKKHLENVRIGNVHLLS